MCIYNASFDRSIINTCIEHYQLEPINYTSTCALSWYAQFYGEWSDYWGNYKWQKSPNGSHRAYGDAHACYKLIKMMAESKDDVYLPFQPTQLFPPKQLVCDWVPWFELGYRTIDKDNGTGRFKRLLKIHYPEF